MEALSPTMEEGQVVKWLKSEGDGVANGDVIAEIETDKATMELTARGDGVLRIILVAEGGTAPVGDVIALIGAADEDISESQPAAGAASPVNRTGRSEAAAAPGHAGGVSETAAGRGDFGSGRGGFSSHWAGGRCREPRWRHRWSDQGFTASAPAGRRVGGRAVEHVGIRAGGAHREAGRRSGDRGRTCDDSRNGSGGGNTGVRSVRRRVR